MSETAKMKLTFSILQAELPAYEYVRGILKGHMSLSGVSQIEENEWPGMRSREREREEESVQSCLLFGHANENHLSICEST